MSANLCGRPTRRGTCQIPLRGGKCVTHDADLAARNANVARSFQSKNPDAFRSQRADAGRLGFAAAGGRIWLAEQTEKARLYRFDHPSAYEQTVAEILAETLTLEHEYDREVIIDGDSRAVDFVIYRDRVPVCAIEVTESETRATWGRDEKLKTKIAWLETFMPTFVFYGAADLGAELARLGEFLTARGVV